MPGSLNIVLHIANEKSFLWRELIFREDVMDFLSFIPNIDVRLVEVLVQTSDCGLRGEMVAMHGAEQERSHLSRAAKFEEVTGMRQLADRILHLTKPAMEPGLQLRQRYVRDVALIK